jgi:hypothetical protein
MNYRPQLVIIHFQPIEFYPPVQNFISVLLNSGIQKEVLIISTTQAKLNDFNLNADSIKILRKNVHSSSRVIRFFKYLNFYIWTLSKLICLRPRKVLYFETISAFPAIVYKLLWRNIHLLVHYHEYSTLVEFQIGMQLVKWNHLLEVKNYSRFAWISHTNIKRIELFKKDNQNITKEICHVMPNYPLSNWTSNEKKITKRLKSENQPIRLVYIGALSIEDTYILEILQFVIDHSDKYDLEVFSFHFSDALNNLINNRKSQNIKFSGPINYNDIPKVLKEKDVGLIFYKGNTPNYIHNAPNKLFEYLACGLDVWFPKEMQGCYEYASNKNPKVIMIDFLNIEKSTQDYLYSHEDVHLNIGFTSEFATREMVSFIQDERK